MNPMISDIADGQRSGRAKTLLGLQTPFLILRRMDDVCGTRETRRKEKRIRGLNLREVSAIGQGLHIRVIKSRGVLGETVVFSGCQVVTGYVVKIGKVNQTSGDIGELWVIKNSDPAPQHHVVRYT